MDRERCTVIGRRRTECCIALTVPRIFRRDKVARTSKVRACHVSQLLALTTSSQGIQSNSWLAEGVEVRSRGI